MQYKILYLNRTAEIAGAEISLIELLQNLDRNKYSPLVIVPSVGPFCERLKTIQVPFMIEQFKFFKTTQPLSFLNTVARLIRLIRGENISLIHANDYMGNQYGVIAAKLTRIPIVVHTRLILGDLACRNSFIKFANHIIANSNATMSALQKARVPIEKISTVWNCVNTDVFRSFAAKDGHELREHLGIPRDAFLLGVIGRIHFSKGHDTFIAAMEKIADKIPKIMGLIVGETKIDKSEEYLKGLQKLVSEHGLEKQIHFIPFQENIVRVYEALDLLVLPSLCEPFGRVIVEAMAMGKPVVATAAGGALEIVEDGITGLLVPPGNIDAMAEAILKLAVSPQSMLHDMGEMGRIRAESLFSPKEHAGKIEEIYQRLLIY
ncbi:MAG: glycosyltransferase family 4 protein [Proteobacteria bacterium]|nr:glycosyltransferase family 4 protein [Pseudomonadota bacterium]